MGYYFSKCSSELYQQKYLDFLLEHYQQLNLPYSFPVSLSFIASPFLLGDDAFLVFNDDEELIGAFGYVLGTGENQYEDTHIVQLQTVFFLEQHRCSLVLLRTLQFLTQYIAKLETEVTELRFWTAADESSRKLFGKIAERTSSVETVFGEIDAYQVPFSKWQSYAAKYRHDIYV